MSVEITTVPAATQSRRVRFLVDECGNPILSIHSYFSRHEDVSSSEIYFSRADIRTMQSLCQTATQAYRSRRSSGEYMLAIDSLFDETRAVISQTDQIIRVAQSPYRGLEMAFSVRMRNRRRDGIRHLIRRYRGDWDPRDGTTAATTSTTPAVSSKSRDEVWSHECQAWSRPGRVYALKVAHGDAILASQYCGRKDSIPWEETGDDESLIRLFNVCHFRSLPYDDAAHLVVV